jgi:hypothetical protein
MLGFAGAALASVAIALVSGSVLAVRADPRRRARGKIVGAIGFAILASAGGVGGVGVLVGDAVAPYATAACVAFLGLVILAVLVDALIFRPLARPAFVADIEEPALDLPVSDPLARSGADDEACTPVKRAEGGGAVPVTRRASRLFWRDSLWGDYAWALHLNVAANDAGVVAVALSDARQRNFWTTTVERHRALAQASGQITCDKVGDDCIPDCTGGENPSDDGPCSAAVLIKGTVQGKSLNVEVTCAASYTAHVTIKKVSVGATGSAGGAGANVSVDIDLPPGDAPKEKVVRTIKYICRANPTG